MKIHGPRFAVIYFLSFCRFIKKLEHSWKALVHDGVWHLHSIKLNLWLHVDFSGVSLFLITEGVLFFQDTVSVHRPGFYAERFQHFMCNTAFKKIPREYAVLRLKPFYFKVPGWIVCSSPTFISIFMSSVKPSPSKKSRGGGQGGLRRAPTLGASTPLSYQAGQHSIDSRLVYHSHFKSTDSEADSGTWTKWRKYYWDLELHH